MKFIVLLAGMALIAFMVATELRTAKVTGIKGAPSGTPAQIEKQTEKNVEKSMQLEEKRGQQAAKAAAAQ